MRLSFALSLAGLALFAPPALGQTDIVSEIRAGAAFEGVELNPSFPVLPESVPLDRLHKVSFEVLFRAPEIDAFEWLGSPRPSVGATVSLSGGDSWAKAGLSWQWRLGETPLFLEAELGGAIHDGYLHDAPEGRRNFGCRTLFYGQATIGADIADKLTASLNFEHGSHAWTCGPVNSGFNAVGFRLGYKF